MLGVNNNRKPIKGDNYKKLKAELDKLVLDPEDDTTNVFENEVIEKTNEFIEEKTKNGEIENIEITPEYNKEDETLVLNINMKMHKPIENVEMTFDKPEGMSDEQFKIFIKHLQEEMEKYDVYEGELTS